MDAAETLRMGRSEPAPPSRLNCGAAYECGRNLHAMEASTCRHFPSSLVVRVPMHSVVSGTRSSTSAGATCALRMVCEQRSPVTVPMHAEIARGTLRSIIRTTELTVDEFLVLLTKA